MPGHPRDHRGDRARPDRTVGTAAARPHPRRPLVGRAPLRGVGRHDRAGGPAGPPARHLGHARHLAARSGRRFVPTPRPAATSRARIRPTRGPPRSSAIRAAGFTAMKFRVGRYPVAHEAKLLEKVRASVPDDFHLMADGNAGYTFPRAIEMGNDPRTGSASSGSRSPSISARAMPGIRASPRPSTSPSPAARSSQSRSEAIDLLGSRRRRHRPAGAGHLRRHHRDAVDRRSRRGPLDPGHAAHVEQRDRDRGRPPGPGQPARSQSLARRRTCSTSSTGGRQPAPRGPPGHTAPVRGRLGDDPRRSGPRRRRRRGIPRAPRGRDPRSIDAAGARVA